MPLRLSDTHPDAEKVLIEGLRAMPLWRKLVIVSDLTTTTRQFALAGLRQRFPGANQADLNRRLAKLCLGAEVATKVYGPELDAPSTS